LLGTVAAVEHDRRVLSLIGEVIGLLDLQELCDGLLRALRAAVPADWAALNEVPAELPYTISISEPPLSDEMHRTFARYAPQNPIVAHFLRTGDGRATRFSDLIDRPELHRLELYRELYSRLGLEYQIAFTLPSRSERILGVSLSRRRRDFTAAERDLLNLCRPYLPGGDGQLQPGDRGEPRDHHADRREAPGAVLSGARGGQPLGGRGACLERGRVDPAPAFLGSLGR
jgi:hypothetical protein